MLRKRILTVESTLTDVFLPFLAIDWEQRKFKDIASRSSEFSSDTNIPRVEYEDIISGEGRLNNDFFVKKSSKSGLRFKSGDVLFGKLRPYLHNWLFPKFDGIAVGDFWVLRSNNIDSGFLYRLIQTPYFDEISNLSSGSKMPRADWNLVSETEFMIPTNSDEQSKINCVFQEVDNLITLHQRKRLIVLYIKQLLKWLFPDSVCQT